LVPARNAAPTSAMLVSRLSMIAQFSTRAPTEKQAQTVVDDDALAKASGEQPGAGLAGYFCPDKARERRCSRIAARSASESASRL